MTPRYAVAYDRGARLWLVLDRYLKRARSSFTEQAGAECWARILNREAGDAG